MTALDKDIQPTDSWMPAIAMLAVALLLVAALLNGVGTVGVMAPASAGDGQYLKLHPLSADREVHFATVDRAIERLDLTASGRPQEYPAYEGLLLALAESLPPTSETPITARVNELLEKSLPAPAAAEVSRMLPLFLAYQQAEKALLGLTPGGPGSIEGAYLRLRLQHALRQEVLGKELTSRLYGASYRMTEVHLVRQMLMQRDDLDDDRKQRLIREHIEAMTVGQTTEDPQ